MREFTPDEKMQILADLRAQKQADDAAWMARLRAAGHCYNGSDHGSNADETHYIEGIASA